MWLNLYFCAEETACTSSKRGAVWKEGQVRNMEVLKSDTEVKLVRFNAVR